MYINNDLCHYKTREENKCGRLFRPWDCHVARNAGKDTAQDCTVSTTTKDDELASEKSDNKQSKSVSKPASIKSDSSSASLSSPSSKMPSKCLNSLPVPELVQEDSALYPKASDASLFASQEMFATASPLSGDFLQDPYNSLTTVQTNLAHQLGLPANDPLILESLAQGYALEEYARVLGQEQQAKLMASKKQRPKKYKCPHCDVGFSNNGQLKGHIRIHTGERPFKCDEKDCGKTFTRNEELTRHKRIHSGLRPFPCSHCGKRFGRKDHLKKHSRTHFQPRGLYAVPVVLPFEAWASGQASGYPFFPVLY